MLDFFVMAGFYERNKLGEEDPLSGAMEKS
jgi:hypothetical protein